MLLSTKRANDPAIDTLTWTYRLLALTFDDYKVQDDMKAFVVVDDLAFVYYAFSVEIVCSTGAHF